MSDDVDYIKRLEQEIDEQCANAKEHVAFLAGIIEEAGGMAETCLDLLVEVVGCPPMSLHPPCDNGYGCPFQCGEDDPDMRECWKEIALTRIAERKSVDKQPERD